MKKQLLFLMLSGILFTAAAQDNKPVKGDWGIRYGLTYNGSVGGQLVVSGYLSDRSEFGSIISVGYSSSKIEEIDSVTVFTQAGVVDGIRSDAEKSSGVSVLINPFYAYHFPIQSNVDLYAGVNAGVGFAMSGPRKEITRTTAMNYERTITNTDKMPMGLVINGGVMLGAQYFFAKRAAFGAVAQLGVSCFSQKGKVKSISEEVNTGSDNPFDDDMSESFYRINDKSLSFGTSSYVGINLAFYFARKNDK